VTSHYQHRTALGERKPREGGLLAIRMTEICGSIREGI
jgi:hypothetical protein